MDAATSSTDEPDTWLPPASVQQKIEDQIRCPVCYEIYREPRALPCFHVYCLQCLLSASSRLRPGNHLACPECRKTVEIPETGVSGLQVAFHVNNLIEIYGSIQDAVGPDAAVAASPTTAKSDEKLRPSCANCGPGTVAGFFCQQCDEFLCGICRVVHGKWKKFSRHELSAITEEMLSRRESACKSHPSQLVTHYCKMCKQLICSECLQERSSSNCTHTQRKVNITEASHLAKDAILASLKPIHGQLASIESVVEQIQAKKQHISEQAADVNSSIDRDFDGLTAALEQRWSELKEAVKREEEKKNVGLREQEENAVIARNQLSAYLGGINLYLHRGNSVQVVKMQQQVEEKVKEILQDFSSMPQAPVEAANLHYFGGRELSASIPPFGSLYFSNITAEDFCVSSDSPCWATACDETSVTIIYEGADATDSSLDHLKLELSSEDGSNSAFFEIQREMSSKQVVVHYIPITKGSKKLHVTLFGHEITSSPLDLSVMGPFRRFKGTPIRCVTELRRPWGVSVSPNGRMVVVDNQGWYAIHLYNAKGTKAHEFASVAIPQTPEIFIADDVCNEPRGVAFTKDGKILLVDGKRHRVLCYNTDGTLSSKVGSYGKGELQFNDPVGITVGLFGQVLVCDRRNHRIQVLTPDLQFMRQIGEFGEASSSGPGLYLPWDVACNSEGDIYVADCGNCCVKVFSSKGEFLMNIGGEGNKRGQFKHVSSISFDSNDYLYVLDKERACVSVFNPRGELKMQFGNNGSAEGQFFKPLGLAVDCKGRVYVSDGESSVWPSGRVQVFE